MCVGPGTVGGDLVGKDSTHGVEEHEDVVVDSFERFLDEALGVLVIKLIHIDLCQHVTADSWVMCVGND